ncbi:hypothetical protein [Geotalea sp. SG265]|uniref:HEAT repeat domain-containing protein n=1 Tax=Geotalea sp. SG265 TaxID=2922867 RepID=UPI001FAFC154|nr:hypothetical protein [Geotalea sp. SG265]
MNKFKKAWMCTRTLSYYALGMLWKGFLMDDENEKKYSKFRLKRIVKSEGIPYRRRLAAIRLYEIGEQEIAINFLIQQMNLYKLPETSPTTIYESCVNTAIALGRLGDKRTEKPLLDALGKLPYFGASYALSQMNGVDITLELEKQASLENEKGIHAVIALGYLKSERVLPWLIEIVENKKQYDEQLKNQPYTYALTHFAFKILGLYDSKRAEDIFKSILDRDWIDILLGEYVSYEKYPNSYAIGNEVGWQVSKKYGWDKYLDTDGALFPFIHTHISHWNTYMKSPCPFNSQEEIDSLKEKILNDILRELGKLD